MGRKNKNKNKSAAKAAPAPAAKEEPAPAAEPVEQAPASEAPDGATSEAPAAAAAVAADAKPAATTPTGRERIRRRSVDLGKSLERRPSVDTLKDTNIIPDEEAKEAATAALTEGLGRRPNEEDLRNRGVLQPSGGRRMSAAMEITGRQLERHIKADTLTGLLDTRPSAEELKGVLRDDGISPSMQATARTLEMQMNRNAVGQLLDTRPDLQDLHDANISASPKVAAGIQQRRRSLHNAMTRDALGYLLSARPDHEELVQNNIAAVSDVAPSIQATRNVLERNMRRATLSRHLEERATPDEIIAAGVHPTLSPEEQGGSAQAAPAPQYAPSKTTPRARYAFALKATARLFSDKVISAPQRRVLKRLILSDDLRVEAAVQLYEQDADPAELLDTLMRLASLESRRQQ